MLELERPDTQQSLGTSPRSPVMWNAHLKAHTLGGEIGVFVTMCEDARAEAFKKMREAAAEMGADGVVGMRFEASDVLQGVTEFLCYGTAIKCEPDSRKKETPR
jgi:uncharacterized protein YbjQ (UPF0145 family)